MKGTLNQLYGAIGITKQAIHQYQKRQLIFDDKVSKLIIEVDELRSQHPGCGVEKMYDTLKPDFIGRDRFAELFMELGYRVKKIKNYHRTTMPVASKYHNLIEGLIINKVNVLWQSDITYYDINGRFYYIVFIIDVYSRKVVGYCVSDSLRAEANLIALRMALKLRSAPMIHHSDKGSQYIDKRYVELLNQNNTAISMGLQAQDNAYAERINGIIKNEFIKYKNPQSFNQLNLEVKKAVEYYNSKRIHRSLPLKLTPCTLEKFALKQQYIVEVHAKDKPRESKESINHTYLKENNHLICNLN